MIKRENVSSVRKKKTFFLQMQKCQMITFVNFEEIANEHCIILLKERRKENS